MVDKPVSHGLIEVGVFKADHGTNMLRKIFGALSHVIPGRITSNEIGHQLDRAGRKASESNSN
jgi:hypothetical protein